MKQASESDVIFEVNTGAISRGFRKSPYPGENLLITYETKNVSIDVDEVRWMINHYLK